MNRTSLAKRYGPLLAVAVVQLLIIATVPSKGPADVAAGATTSAASAGPTGDVAASADQTAAGSAAGSTTSGGAAGSSTAAGAAGRAAGSTAAGAPPGVVPGDTSHCVGGKEFDPSVAYYAPPCVQGTPGGAYAGDNGGATYKLGVTKDTITIVDYLTNYGAEVNAILAAQGSLETYQQGVVLDKAFETFINKYFVLYGRKVKIIPYQGQCQSVPPDMTCLPGEMDSIVDQYHPYMVFWNTTLCSDCYKELVRKGTIAIGGIGFSDEFAAAQNGHFYASGMSSTEVETAFADWWCSQMSSQSVPSRTTKFAMTNNPAQNFNGKPRVLGVISTNDPDNQNTVEKTLYGELARRCHDDAGVRAHHYYYAQDINTASQQTKAGIDAMDTTSNPATTVLCICDQVAPDFLYQGENQNNYWPENVIGDVQGMGQDVSAQGYEGSLACPGNASGSCNYDNAIGLADADNDHPPAQMEGPKIFKMGGGQGDPPASSSANSTLPTANTVNTLAKSWVMMASLIENTGPTLTPENMAARAPALGAVGGGTSQRPLLSFAKGIYNWTHDVRLVWWNKHKNSPYNDSAGSYIPIGGTRYRTGQFPAMPNSPDVPTADKRT
jgi:hypothetical protein